MRGPPTKTHALLSTYINLLKTVLGCGMLTFPVLINNHGILRTSFVVLASALFSATSLVLYAKANDPKLCENLSLLTKTLSRRLCLLVDICVCAKCFAVGVLFLVVIRNVFTFLCIYARVSIRSDTLLIVLVCLISPFCYLQSLDRLRIVSAAGLLCILCMVLVSLSKFERINVYAKTDSNVWRDLGQFVYSFTCHQNVITCQYEHRLSSAAIVPVAAAVVVSASAVYLTYGICLSNSLSLENDTLKALQHSATLPIALSLAAYALMLGLSLPLQLVPCKQTALSLFKIDSFRAVPNITATTTILGSMLILALYAPSFALLASCIGGSFSALICYIFGAVLYLLSKRRARAYVFAAYATLGFGFLAIACFLYDIGARVSEKLSKS